jgi:hypothetical protein
MNNISVLIQTKYFTYVLISCEPMLETKYSISCELVLQTKYASISILCS